MKILFLIRSLDHGGAERQLAVLAPALARRGHRVAVAVFYGRGALQPELERNGVAVHDLGKTSRWDLPGFLLRLVRLVRRERPDILHGILPVPDILAALLSFAVRGMRVVLGVRSSDMDLSRYDRLAASAYWVESRLAGRAALVVCNSEAGRRQAVGRGFPEARCRVIRNGIDVGRFFPDRETGRPLRQAWGVGAEDRLVGLVGRLDPMKGHEAFLRAAALAAARDRRLRFACIGSGTLGRSLHDLAGGLGLPVVWAEARDDMAAVYNALDLLVVPSLYGEGFSNVLAEGMACGLPCIATPVGDSAAILERFGTLVPIGAVEPLAEAMLAAPTGPLAEAAEHIRRNFSVERLAVETETALQGLLR